MMPITCHKCSILFPIVKREYKRQLKNGRKHFFCSLSCASSFNKNTTTKLLSNCLRCGKQFETTTHKNAKNCCSKVCARKYAQSFVDTSRLSKSMKQAWASDKFANVKRILEPRVHNFECVICNSPFQRITKKLLKTVKTCSRECFRQLCSKNSRSNPNCGGETNYRRYRYKGILMDSKWELELAQWMDEKGIVWDRSKKRHQLFWFDANGVNRRYYPDFFIPKMNIYIDPKNPYLMQKDKYKLEKVIERNNVEIVFGNLDSIKQTLSERCINN